MNVPISFDYLNYVVQFLFKIVLYFYNAKRVPNYRIYVNEPAMVSVRLSMEERQSHSDS